MQSNAVAPDPASDSPPTPPALTSASPAGQLPSSNNSGRLTSPKIDEQSEEKGKRERWGSQFSFIFFTIGYVVGLGNAWRFPKLIFENGGVAFLIPYGIVVMLLGLPGVYFEFLIGQSTQACANKAFRMMAPFFQGLGWTMCLVALGIAVYYNVLISWVLLYIVESLQIPLTGKYVWSRCNNTWNNERCISASDNKHCQLISKGIQKYAWNGSCVGSEKKFLDHAHIDHMNQSESATQQFFKRYILMSTSNIEDFGSFNWKVFIALAVVWIVTCVAIMFGTKWMGYTGYITGTAPYAIMGIIFFRGITLPHAFDGVNYFLYKGDFTKLLDFEVWAKAVAQVLFSLGMGIAGLPDLSAHNDRKHNSFRDAIIVVAADSFMSIFAGISVFAILGYMANASNRDVSDVINDGTALAFIAYPEATTLMPAMGWLFGVLFFVMLFLLGIGSQIGFVMVLVSAFADVFPKAFWGRPKLIIAPLVSLVGFSCGIIMCFGNGQAWLDLIDDFAGSLGCPLGVAIAFFVVNGAFGIRRFLTEVRLLYGRRRNFFTRWFLGARARYFIVCWMFITPTIGVIVFFNKFISLLKLDGSQKNPTWTYYVGIFLFFLQMAPIIGFAVANTIIFRHRKMGWSKLFMIQPEHPSYEQLRYKRGVWDAIKDYWKSQMAPDVDEVFVD